MSDKPKTPSSKLSLTAIEWKALMSDPFKDGNRIITDSEEKGLELRIIGRKVAWVTRYRKAIKTIGFAVAPTGEKMMLTTPKEARVVHNAVKDLISMHPDRVDFFLPVYYSQPDPKKRSVAKAADIANYDYLQKHTSKLTLVKSWTLEKCYAEFLKIRTDGKSKQQLDDSSVKDYNTTFKRKEVQPYMKRSVIDMSPEIAERLRDQISAEYGPNPAKKWVSHLRTLLTFTMRFNRASSGLDKSKFGAGWWLTLTDFHEVKRKKRMPSVRGIGVTLALAEHFMNYPIPGRDGVQHGIRSNVLAGLWWIIIGAQRADAAVKLKRENYVPYPGYEGWKCASWTSDVMKGGRVFMLPIPPKAVAVLDRMIGHNSNSMWCFQSERSVEDDIPIHRSAVLNALERLAGTDATAKQKGNGVDLFALNGEQYWSPHDIRRALTDVMEQQAIPGGASAVLDHKIEAGMKMDNEQLQQWNLMQVSKVTEDKYGDIQFMYLKRPAMKAWVDAVLESYEKVKAEGVIVDVDGTLSTDAAACERKHKELLARYAENKRRKKKEKASARELEAA